MNQILQAIIISTTILPLHVQAGPIDDLTNVLRNRQGGASEDRRTDVKDPTGLIKIGCRGDTLDATVVLKDISGKIEGDTVKMTVTYTGKYYRQGWDIPCQKVSPVFHGLEEKNLSGTYTFSVAAKPFQRPIITWGQGSGFGEVVEPGHDSNIFAIRAVQNAISSAF